MGGTRALLGLVIGLAVLIVGGFAVVVSTLAHRALAPERARPVEAMITLGEPQGTRISALVANGDRLALLLQGGGSDRVVLIDAQDGRRVGTISISGPVGSLAEPPR